MPAYVIVNINVTDPVPYERYKTMAEATVTAYGGKYIVRGGLAERLEGGWEPKRFVVLEFPDAARAKAWWASEDYRPAKELRQACARSDMIVVTGIEH
jgi:uncharacterized protein (DUF1330 family)